MRRIKQRNIKYQFAFVSLPQRKAAKQKPEKPHLEAGSLQLRKPLGLAAPPSLAAPPHFLPRSVGVVAASITPLVPSIPILTHSSTAPHNSLSSHTLISPFHRPIRFLLSDLTIQCNLIRLSRFADIAQISLLFDKQLIS